MKAKVDLHAIALERAQVGKPACVCEKKNTKSHHICSILLSSPSCVQRSGSFFVYYCLYSVDFVRVCMRATLSLSLSVCAYNAILYHGWLICLSRFFSYSSSIRILRKINTKNLYIFRYAVLNSFLFLDFLFVQWVFCSSHILFLPSTPISLSLFLCLFFSISLIRVDSFDCV